MKRSDLVTHIAIAIVAFLALVPSLIHHGVSLNSQIYLVGALVNIVGATIYYFFAGADI